MGKMDETVDKDDLVMDGMDGWIVCENTLYGCKKN